MARRGPWLGAIAVAAAAAAAAFVALRGGPAVDTPAPGDRPRVSAPDARPPAPPRAGRDGGGAESAASSAAPADEASPALRSLAAAFAVGHPDAVRGAAESLRAQLRTDPAARAAAERALLDRSLATDVRSALALVLGTLPGSPSEAALAAALAACDDPALERCLVLALGAYPCDDDDAGVFSMGERPWGAWGPAGLGITVRRTIDTAAVRAEIAERLRRDDASLRGAAAAALRHSIAQADVSAAFSAALGTEADDDVATALGESLAGWASHDAPPGVRDVALAAIVARADDAALDTYRFRIEDDLRGARFSAADRARLRLLADAPRPFGVRAFALTVLAAARASDEADATAEARALLVATLAGDEDPAARDLSARLLGSLAAEDSTVAALARSASHDAEWNVRHAAVSALGRFGARDDARTALRSATSDRDSRVAERATELLSGR